MNWVERHLNWAVVLTCVGAVLAVSGCDLVVSKSLEITLWLQIALWLFIFPAMQVFILSDGTNIPLLLATVAFWGVPLASCAWVLRKKSQSLCWLLVAWTPYAGWFVPIALENRRQLSSPAASSHAAAQSAAGPLTKIEHELGLTRANLRNYLVSLVAVVSVVCMVLSFVNLALCVLAMVSIMAAGYPDEGSGVNILLGVALYGPGVLLGGGIISGGSTLMLLQKGFPRSSRRRKLGYVTMTTCAAIMAVYVVGCTISLRCLVDGVR